MWENVKTGEKIYTKLYRNQKFNQLKESTWLDYVKLLVTLYKLLDTAKSCA